MWYWVLYCKRWARDNVIIQSLSHSSSPLLKLRDSFLQKDEVIRETLFFPFQSGDDLNWFKQQQQLNTVFLLFHLKYHIHISYCTGSSNMVYNLYLTASRRFASVASKQGTGSSSTSKTHKKKLAVRVKDLQPMSPLSAFYYERRKKMQSKTAASSGSNAGSN